MSTDMHTFHGLDVLSRLYLGSNKLSSFSFDKKKKKKKRNVY
jgi:hypothetical protein